MIFKKNIESKPRSELQTLSTMKSHYHFRLKGAIALLEEIDRCYSTTDTSRIQEDIIGIYNYIEELYLSQKLEILKERNGATS